LWSHSFRRFQIRAVERDPFGVGERYGSKILFFVYFSFPAEGAKPSHCMPVDLGAPGLGQAFLFHQILFIPFGIVCNVFALHFSRDYPPRASVSDHGIYSYENPLGFPNFHFWAFFRPSCNWRKGPIFVHPLFGYSKGSLINFRGDSQFRGGHNFYF